MKEKVYVKKFFGWCVRIWFNPNELLMLSLRLLQKILVSLEHGRDESYSPLSTTYSMVAECKYANVIDLLFF